MDLGQTAVVSSSANPSVEIKVAHSLLDDAVTADNSTSPTELEFGSEMAGMCGQRECSPGIMCLGCQVKIITYKEDFFNDQSPDKPNILPGKVRERRMTDLVLIQEETPISLSVLNCSS